MVEFIDCGSLSITYDATGKASISFSVLTDNDKLTDDYTDKEWGSIRFDCVITNVMQRPIIGSKKWFEWSIQMEGVGNY